MMKRGSIEISFGMIFSIIVMVAIIGVAVYAITVFLNVGKVTEIGLFHQRFQETVDDIWSSAVTNRAVSFSLPKSIELVCFGSIANPLNDNKYSDELNELRDYSSGFQQQNTNTFLYPPSKADDFAFKKVEKIDVSSLGTFDCFEVKNGKVNIRLSKNEFDSLVKVGRE